MEIWKKDSACCVRIINHRGREVRPYPQKAKRGDINVPTEPKLPQTGDNANPLLYLGIGALALITGVGVGLRGRKKKNKQ